MKRTELLSKLSIFIVPIITILVYITGFSMVDIILGIKTIRYIFNQSFIERLNQPSTKISIDIAVLTIIFMLLIRAFDLIKVKLSITNTDRTGELYIKNKDRKSKVLEFTFNINFRSRIVKNMISSLGTLKIKIYKPNGVKITIKNKVDFNSGALDDTSNSSFIIVDILEILDRDVFTNEVYLLLDIEPNDIIHDLNRQVSTELIVESHNDLKKIALYIIRVFMINGEMDKHYIRIRK